MGNKNSGDHQKRGMKLIQNKYARINDFSKRKASIFTKASELCTFLGTEIGMIFFSPTGKPYSYAHPSIESVITKFLDHNPTPNNSTTIFGEVDDEEIIHELNQKCNKVLKQLEAKKEKGKLLDQMEKERISKGGLMAPINELSLQELEQLTIQMKELQKHLNIKIEARELEARNEAASTSTIATTNVSHETNPFADGTLK